VLRHFHLVDRHMSCTGAHHGQVSNTPILAEFQLQDAMLSVQACERLGRHKRRRLGVQCLGIESQNGNSE